MLISTRKKFIFVSNTKTASTSIELLLKHHSQIVITAPPYLKHMNYRDIIHMFDKLFQKPEYNVNKFYKFGVFREPVDWIISWFNYRSRQRIANPKHRGHSTYLGNISFEEYVDSIDKDWLKPQKYKFINEKGENAMDFLIDYDRLEQDLAFIWKKLEIEVDDWKLPHKNKSKKNRVKKENLTSNILSKIKDYCAEDYDFIEKVKAKQNIDY